MMNMRARPNPALGLMAALAGFACLAGPAALAPASAQVLGNGAYAPTPDPFASDAVDRLILEEFRAVFGTVPPVLERWTELAIKVSVGRVGDRDHDTGGRSGDRRRRRTCQD